MRECGPKVQRGGLDPLDLMISTTHCALFDGVSGSLCLRKEVEKKKKRKGEEGRKINHFACRCPLRDPLIGIRQALLYSNTFSISDHRIKTHICKK